MRLPRLEAVISAAIVVATGATHEAIGSASCSIPRQPLAPPRVARETLDFDLATKLDHAVGRQLEEFHRAFGVAKHPREEFFAPDRHPGSRRGNQRLPSEEEAGVHHLAWDAAPFELGEFGRHVD